MVYTLTMNPSLDYKMFFKHFNAGELNRSLWEVLNAGGKGINVSAVLKTLGVTSTCLGFIAGRTGSDIESRLKESGCQADFIRLSKGTSRINIKVKEADGRETELNGSGPDPGGDEIDLLKEKISKIQEGDILILSGNVQKGVSSEIYGDIARIIDGKKIRLVVDAEKELLFPTLKFHPFLIKPNLRELCEMVGRELSDREDIERGAEEMCSMGAENVLVSLGGKGAFFCSESGERYWIKAPKGTVIDTVGSGDAMIAGFIRGFLDGRSKKECLCLATAAGSANAFSLVLPDRESISCVHQQIRERESEKK